MHKRLQRRVPPLLLALLACVGVAACAVYSIRAAADAGTGIGARKAGASRQLRDADAAATGSASSSRSVGAAGPAVPTGSAGATGPAGPAGAADGLSGVGSSVAPGVALVAPDLFVLATRPLTDAQRDAVRAAAGRAGHVLFADAGTARIGAGTTLALGVRPDAFRAYTPANTAGVTPLWDSIAAGDLTLAHEFASAQHLQLGGTVVAGPLLPTADTGRALRVGAYATTGLPGVGALVDRSQSVPIGLVRDAAALVDVPPGDPAAARRAVSAAVPGALTVSLSGPGPRTAATAGRSAAGPAGGTNPWVLPAQGPVASRFGPRPGEFHPGLDLAAPLGAPIVAAADGVVTSAGPASGFGNAIVLAHDRGVQTVYGHMRYWFVRPGQRVRAGQLIALVGTEGRSTGPHLHFEVHLAGKLTDPAAWLVAHAVTIPAR